MPEEVKYIKDHRLYAEQQELIKGMEPHIEPPASSVYAWDIWLAKQENGPAKLARIERKGLKVPRLALILRLLEELALASLSPSRT